MPNKDGLTQSEKAMATDVAVRLFERMVCDAYGPEDPRTHLDFYRDDPNGRSDQILQSAEACFSAAILFLWARHRVLDNCPDYEARK